MAKHANGEGSVFRRKDGRWEAAVVLDGHRFRFYGPTREAVNGQLVAALKAHQDGSLPGGGRETLGRFWDVWLPGCSRCFDPGPGSAMRNSDASTCSPSREGCD